MNQQEEKSGQSTLWVTKSLHLPTCPNENSRQSVHGNISVLYLQSWYMFIDREPNAITAEAFWPPEIGIVPDALVLAETPARVHVPPLNSFWVEGSHVFGLLI